MSLLSQKSAQSDLKNEPNLTRAEFSFDEESLPNVLYLQVREADVFSFLETGTLTWLTVGDFVQDVGLELPKLLTGTFQDLRDIFFKNFMSNPKSREIIALQDQWRLDIAEEFQKPNAGVFKNTIQTMVKTNEQRWKTLEKLRLLRVFEKTGPRKGFVSLKVCPRKIETTLFTKMIPVVCREGVTDSLQEKIFMRGMFGPKYTPIEHLYKDLFCQRPFLKSFWKEHLLFASSKGEKPLRMKVPDESLQSIETSNRDLCQKIDDFLGGDSLYSSGKVLHTNLNK